MPAHPFTPQLVSVIREGYTLRRFSGDLLAGVITGIVAMPLAIAFAIASGVPAENGLYTAIIAGFIISVLSGSRVQIGGPTGAYIVIVAGIYAQYGMAGLTIATIMAGVILLFMGALRFGGVIRFIPFPVTLGFTSGIALVIGATQIKDALGLKLEGAHGGLVPCLHACFGAIGETNLWALGLCAATVLVIVLWPRVTLRVPGSIVAVVLCTAVAPWLPGHVETIGSRFGEVKAEFPPFAFPDISYDLLQQMLPAAMSIAMLGAIESLLSAVVADGMTGGRHRANMELIAQGVANVFTPLFGGIPATGAIARTATNIRNGGRTPIAGIIHAVTLLLLVLCLGKLAARIPMPVLAGVLLTVAWNMSEAPLFVRMFRAPKSDVVVMVVTFLLTAFLDLTIAIPAGMVMASFLFMLRMEQVAHVNPIRESDDEERADPLAISQFIVPEGVEVYEIHGPFFFGAAHKMQNAFPNLKPKVLIVRMRNVPAIDATGLFALEAFVKNAAATGTRIILSGLQEQPTKAIDKVRLIDIHANIISVPDIAVALENANIFLAQIAAEKSSASRRSSVSGRR